MDDVSDEEIAPAPTDDPGHRRTFGPPPPAGYSVLDDPAVQAIFRLRGAMTLPTAGGGSLAPTSSGRLIWALIDAVRGRRETWRRFRDAR